MLFRSLAHAFQNNTLGGLKKAKNSNQLVYDQKITEKLGDDISSFLNDPKGYSSLVKSLDQKQTGSMYSAKTIMNEPHELFTSLVQASNSPQFKKNKQAVNMLKKLMAAHGYSTGGIVYANNGALIAARRGSDSVPAIDRKSTRLNSSHSSVSRMPSSA